MNLFGQSLEEKVKDWKKQLVREQRIVNRHINNITTQQLSVKKSIKEAAKKNNRFACVLLAKEIISSQKQKERLIMAKAQLNSVCMQLQQQQGRN